LTRIVSAFAVCLIAVTLAFGLSPRHQAQAAPLVFQADMYPRNVVPPVNDAISYGFVRFFFNDARTEADYTVDVKGLSNSLVSGADLYAGLPGTRGTLVRHLADGGFIVTAGHMSFTPANWASMAAGEWYVQVTSTLNPEGAMRGPILLPPGFFSTIPGYTPGLPQPSFPPQPPVTVPAQPILAPPVIVQGPPLLNTVPVTPVTQSETGFTVYEDCISRSVRLRLQWVTLNAGAQFIDLSLQNNGWEDGTYVGSQALSPETTTILWDGLVPGELHYLRVNTQLPDGSWQPSTTIAFMTRNDCTR
jgi:hypothetical protein